MVVETTRDRRAERRAATRAEILEAAWALARIHGLAGLSLRDVARTIGMRPPSLYWYFESKQAIYDEMFAQANRQLLAVKNAFFDLSGELICEAFHAILRRWA